MRSKIALALTVVAALSMLVTPSGANVAVSPPAAEVHGVFGVPATPIAKAQPVTYVNTDPAGAHNIVSDAKTTSSRPWCGVGRAFTQASCPLFYSGPEIGLGETAVVQGTDKLTAGTTYTFYCQPHPNMKGSFLVVA